MFCTYLELDMDIDVVICCVELVAIVFKFCTCELLDMDNGVDFDVKLVAIVLIFHVNTQFQKITKNAKYTHNIPRYEMARLDKIRQNQERIDTLGLKHISTSLKDTAQSNCAKRKRSRASVVVDDDYVPPIGDDDNDNESSNSVIHKVQQMFHRVQQTNKFIMQTRGNTNKSPIN